jgi:hypothetical protein
MTMERTMDQVLPAPTLLTPTKWCVVRKQKERYLIYNSRTDEMHLVPPILATTCISYATALTR